MNHHQIATQYAIDVINGDIKACVVVKQACQRFINDLEKAENEDYSYYFKPSYADHLCDFIEKLPHTKGAWASRGEKIKLEPWQSFVLANIGGWLDKKTDQRRFTKAYVRVARKNGKSIFAAGLGLYFMTADGEYGSEVYCGATNERQAYEVFTPARVMCERTPDLCSAFGINVYKKIISRSDDNSKFEPVIGRPKDGSSPSLGIVDEYHEHTDSDTVDTFETGMGARAMEGSPLLFIITTAGFNIEGPCYDEDTNARQVLSGAASDERTFAIIYELDDKDDWTNAENFIKANPNLDVSVSKQFLIDSMEKAKRDTKKQNAFITKHLNRWVNAAESWILIDEWNKCGADFKEEDFTGWECIHSVDLASRVDVASHVLTFFKEIDGVMNYAVFPRLYLPSLRVNIDKTGKYKRWAQSGELIVTDGAETDFNFIQRRILEDSKKYGCVELAYDPWNCTKLAQELTDAGLNCIEFGQTVKNMSGPMYECEAAVKSERIHHPENRCLSWMMGNIQCKTDHNDNIFPRKPAGKNSHTNKIDGGVCVIMGVARAMTYKNEQPDFSEGLMVI